MVEQTEGMSLGRVTDGQQRAAGAEHAARTFAEAMRTPAAEPASERKRPHADAADSKRFERAADIIADTIQAGGRDVRDLLTLSDVSGAGLADLQQTLQRLTEAVVQANLRSAQALFELADPTDYIALQRRFVHDYLRTLAEGSAMILRAALQVAEEKAHALGTPEPAGDRVREGDGRDERPCDPAGSAHKLQPQMPPRARSELPAQAAIE